jgi:hypothetical protein
MPIANVLYIQKALVHFLNSNGHTHPLTNTPNLCINIK